MSYQHPLDNRGSARIGSKAEREYISVASKRGFKCRISNTYENTILGIDIWIERKVDNTKTIKGVDVKGPKSFSKEGWTWVEFVASPKAGEAYPGWLYKKADYIAFDKGDHFLVVDRESLKDLCETLVDRNKEKVKTAKEAKYRIYQRRDEEETALIKTSDIMTLKRKSIWKKQK